MDKKQRKLIEAEVENAISTIEERLINVNAIKEHINYNKPLSKPLTTIELMGLLTSDSRHIENLEKNFKDTKFYFCLLYTSPSPRDATLSRMPSSA